MSVIDTATVETLAAEVRVLMVGNRQITLSVARQLDEVPLGRLDVFGRIKLGTDKDHVIGRSYRSGALVVACIPQYWTVPWVDTRTLLEWARGPLVVCRKSGNPGSSFFTLTLNDRQFRVAADAVNYCDLNEDHSGHGDWDARSFSAAEHLIDGTIDYAERVWDEMVPAARQAPLIVLAGLR